MLGQAVTRQSDHRQSNPILSPASYLFLRKSLHLSGLSSSIYKKAKVSEPRVAYTDFSQYMTSLIVLTL